MVTNEQIQQLIKQRVDQLEKTTQNNNPQSSLEMGAAIALLQESWEDKQRVDYLEQLLWSSLSGNGLAIIPFTSAGDKQYVMLQDLGTEDGTHLGDELTDADRTLREAVDVLRKNNYMP